MPALTQLEIWTEEPSMRAALSTLLPKVVPGVGFRVFAARNKQDLLARLPGIMRGYAQWIPGSGVGVVVVVDRDADDCVSLLSTVTNAAVDSGLAVVSVSRQEHGDVCLRLVIEELEAWWFGAPDAVAQAYPRVRVTAREFRSADAVAGGTWEAFERALQRAGYHLGGLRKLAAAEELAPLIDVDANSSPSFQKFRDGVRLLVNGAA